jgi:hypothetical protein
MKYSQTAFFHRPIQAIHRTAEGTRGATVRPISAWLRRVALATVAVSLPVCPAVVATVFSLTNTTLPGIAYGAVACADFANDGKPDVLVTGLGASFTPICQVWHNKTNGVFTNLNVTLPGVSSSAIARGDLFNDGRADFLCTGYGGMTTNNFPVYLSQIWRNLGNGNFTNVPTGLPGVDTGAVALGDFDNDGNLDILLTGYSATGAVAQVWRNLGNGTFTNLHAGLPGVLYSSVALGDYDNDGKLDILLTGTTNGFGSGAISQLWRNLGNGTFTNINLKLPGMTQGAVAWGDFNNEGRLDILLTGFTTTGAVCQVWRNLGNGHFTNMNVGLPGIYQSSVALADYDNDGKLDIVLAGRDNQTNPICQVWRNTGNWVFTNLNAGLTGMYAGSVAWADFHNDGRLDLLVSGLNSAAIPMIQVYHNNTPLTNASPLRINGLINLANHSHQLAFGGQAGFGYTVWGSTNRQQWAALGIPNAGNPGTFQFTDCSATNLNQRYYRVSRP